MTLKPPTSGSTPDSSVPTSAVNVLDYGAGTTGDDSTFLDAARDAAGVGGVLLFPAGTYHVSRPFRPLRGQTLLGYAVPNWWNETNGAQLSTIIRGTAGFSGSALIQLAGKETTGASVELTGVRVEGIAVDGSAIASGTPDNFQVYGRVRDAWLVRCYSGKARGRGFALLRNTSTYVPQETRLQDCIASSSVSKGFYCEAYDTFAYACEALTNTGAGFHLTNSGNSGFFNCRAEWNGAEGLLIDGSIATNDDLMVLGFSTDRNERDGILITDNNGSQPITLQAMLGRDGRNGNAGGGSYAGLRTGSGNFVAPIVAHVTVRPGRDDDGTGSYSPQIGVSVQRTTPIALSGFVWGVTSSIVNNGTSTIRKAPDLIEITGSPGAQTIASTPSFDESSRLQWNASEFYLDRASANVLRLVTANFAVQRTNSTDLAYSALVTGDGFDRVRVWMDSIEWGPGNAARDAKFGRIGVDMVGSFSGDKLIASAGLGVGNAVSATESIGKAVTKKIQVYDSTGTSIGFVPVYASIT